MYNLLPNVHGDPSAAAAKATGTLHAALGMAKAKYVPGGYTDMQAPGTNVI